MQIIEISEPGQKGSEIEVAVGIDFGTTNSLIAVSIDHTPKIIPDKDGAELVPSVISFDLKDNDYEFIIGKEGHKKNVLKSVKRLLAKSTGEILSNPNLHNLCKGLLNPEADIPKLVLGAKEISMPVAASKIFAHLKHQAEQYLGHKVSKAVVSVPAYFDDSARGQVLLAAKIAGFDVMRLIAEPTAAAYAYGLNKEVTGSYLIYDLGGGTFDVSVLNMEAGVLQVVATGGDNMLGGDDIDYLLAEYIAEVAGIEVTSELQTYARKLKEELATNDEVTIQYQGKGVTISSEQFNEIISELIERTIQIAKEAHFEAGRVKLDGIILVGGSTRIPLIASELKKAFGVKVFEDIDPDKAVALGAALQAENLSGRSNALLIDALPLSLGIELYGGIVEKIILKNTPVPFAVKKRFTTHLDNQTGMKFHILQGERELAADCRSLAHFELKNIPKGKAGTAKIEVTFAIDADGILAVTAVETETGLLQNIEIRPSFGLSEEEVNATLLDAYKNAGLDHESRLLLEARISGEDLINNLLKAIDETPDILTNIELAKVDEAIKALQNVINLDNREDILHKMEILGKVAKDFIQKHLDHGAEVILEGRHIDTIVN
jgi:molecular chaperone HscA